MTPAKQQLNLSKRDGVRYDALVNADKALYQLWKQSGAAKNCTPERMDWERVAPAGWSPCFSLEAEGTFCGRAERWIGHYRAHVHKFVSLADLLREVTNV